MNNTLLMRHNLKEDKIINLLGFLFFFGSLYYFVGNINFDYYKFMFQQLPEQIIKIRYVFSLSLRFIGIFVGIGLILRKEFFRKTAVLLCVFTIVTIYWKHPFYVFNNIAIKNQFGILNTSGQYNLEYPWHPWFSMIFFYAADIFFALIIIVFFTKQKIKEKFK